MAGNDAGKQAKPIDSNGGTLADDTATRQAIKDCYCGLGPECTHWEEMTPQGRVDCARDKRAAVDALWKNGTIT